ncbi:glycine/betaine ABC transporter substrate-binding protein [Streptomyces sp. N2-109]|uniref:Glycine/betaine ABC transporter substrate-binding protein n=1 Tax=Streptomyces gossypii TaxID=2883101 RepID=A0ABT2K063_9ACTN|nr:glycine betaine ABC transporter substrate-binding protein [Streptomyces gossypii]MCT2593564.1 glycine/betaine ABC transporter substrate-binding protein [Streptomyces gossypii]
MDARRLTRTGGPGGPGSATRARRRLCVLLALAVLAVAGCSGAAGESGSVGERDLRGGSLAEEFDLKGAQFTVGSKEFTEQQILGKIMLYALRAAGARTGDQTGLNGSTIVRSALESGDVDMYWEYSGTGWTQFLGHDTPVQGTQKQFRATAREDARRNGIEWLGPARFGNQYAIARSGDATGALGEVERLSDLKDFGDDHPGGLTLCGAAEFLDREIRAIQKTYEVTFPAPQVYQNALALNYVNVAKGSPCQFAEVFTTDARLESLNLKVLEDDRGHFTTELAALTVRKDTLGKYPELAGLAERIGQKLTKATVIDLNAMVDLDGRTADDAALYFLRTHGFIGE